MTRSVNSERETSVYLPTSAGSQGYGGRRNQYVAAITATLSAFCMGMCMAWSSTALPMLETTSDTQPIETNANERSWIGALIALGALCGASVAGRLCKRCGPKRTLQFMVLPLFKAWVITAFSPTVLPLYISRFIMGIAVGVISVACPTYVTEIAEVEVRGTLGTLFQLQITLGMLSSYFIGCIVDSFTLLALISLVFPLVYLFALSFMPESPVHLASQNDADSVLKSLRWLRAAEYDVQAEVTRITTGPGGSDGSFVDLLKSRTATKALAISLALMLFQQLSGINAVVFYATSIFRESGTALPAAVCSILIGIVQVLATYASTLLIDRTGRRILLLISSSVMSMCLIVLGLYFHLHDTHDLSNLAFTPLVCLAVYVVVFSIGFGPIPWIMMGEMFEPKIKHIAAALSVTLNWILAFAVTKLFQDVKDALGAGLTFGLFGVICCIGFFFVLAKVPETKGKSVDQVVAILSGQGKVAGCEDEEDCGIYLKPV